MTKIIASVWRDAARDASSFRALVDRWAHEAGSAGAVLGLVINLAIADQGPYTREPDERGLVPTADAVVAVWIDDAASTRVVDPLGALGRRFMAWTVDEYQPKHSSRTWRDGTESPGVKMISLMRRDPSLSRDEFAQHWLERHAPLAVRHHVGLWNYTQNVVVETLTDDGGDVDGIAELHFETRSDFTERFFDSPDGMRIIRDDVARFMTRASSDAAVFTETVWRTPPERSWPRQG